MNADPQLLVEEIEALKRALEEKSALLNAITTRVCTADFHLIGRMTAGWSIPGELESASTSEDVEAALAALWERSSGGN